MADTTIKITAGYKDFTTRNFEFGKFNDESARLGAIFTHPKTELTKLIPFLNKTISYNGAEFGEIQNADIISTTRTPIQI